MSESSRWFSVIKAGYLTLFEMFGYRYALSPSGVFVGKLLGTFYGDILAASAHYLGPSAVMVRPIASDRPDILGTIDDGLGRMCWLEGVEPSRPWAMIVFVRAGKRLNAALMPMFDDEPSANRFVQLLQAGKGRLLTGFARLHHDQWSVDKERITEHWPPASFAD